MTCRRLPSTALVVFLFFSPFCLAQLPSQPPANAASESSTTVPSSTATTSDLGHYFPGIEIARCLFPQGKLVLQKGADLHVVRVGDGVPGVPGLKVLEMTDRHAVLIQGPKGSGPSATTPIPERLVKIEKGLDGEVTVTVLSARNPRAESPEHPGEQLIYSPWAEDAGRSTEGGFAPLVKPRKITGSEADGSEGGQP